MEAEGGPRRRRKGKSRHKRGGGRDREKGEDHATNAEEREGETGEGSHSTNAEEGETGSRERITPQTLRRERERREGEVGRCEKVDWGSQI